MVYENNIDPQISFWLNILKKGDLSPYKDINKRINEEISKEKVSNYRIKKIMEDNGFKKISLIKDFKESYLEIISLCSKLEKESKEVYVLKLSNKNPQRIIYIRDKKIYGPEGI